MREAEHYRQLLERFVPDLTIERFEATKQGWDSAVFEVNGEWIFRFPLLPEAERVRAEVALLAELAPALPVPIPEVEVVVEDDAIFVGYRKLAGDPIDAAVARGADELALAAQLGEFLSSLHAFPVERAAQLAVRSTDSRGWLARQREFRTRLEQLVFPLLESKEQATAGAMFEDFFRLASNAEPETVLIHADLGPEHILCRRDHVSGVIDWSDARVGDAALDFAWLLHGIGDAFAEALLEAYGTSRPLDRSLRERALFYHRLGPWHEVLYGLDLGGPRYVQSGLAGIRKRLPRRKYDRNR